MKTILATTALALATAPAMAGDYATCFIKGFNSVSTLIAAVAVPPDAVNLDAQMEASARHEAADAAMTVSDDPLEQATLDRAVNWFNHAIEHVVEDEETTKAAGISSGAGFMLIWSSACAAATGLLDIDEFEVVAGSMLTKGGILAAIEEDRK